MCQHTYVSIVQLAQAWNPHQLGGASFSCKRRRIRKPTAVSYSCTPILTWTLMPLCSTYKIFKQRALSAFPIALLLRTGGKRNKPLSIRSLSVSAKRSGGIPESQPNPNTTLAMEPDEREVLVSLAEAIWLFGSGCQNRYGIPFWGLGEFTTHFRTYF